MQHLSAATGPSCSRSVCAGSQHTDRVAPQPPFPKAAQPRPRTQLLGGRHPQAWAASRRSSRARRAGAAAALSTDASPSAGRTFPAFLPPEIEEIQEEAALNMAARIERVPVNVPCMGREVLTAFVGPSTRPGPPAPGEGLARRPPARGLGLLGAQHGAVGLSLLCCSRSALQPRRSASAHLAECSVAR